MYLVYSAALAKGEYLTMKLFDWLNKAWIDGNRWMQLVPIMAAVAVATYSFTSAYIISPKNDKIAEHWQRIQDQKQEIAAQKADIRDKDDKIAKQAAPYNQQIANLTSDKAALEAELINTKSQLQTTIQTANQWIAAYNELKEKLKVANNDLSSKLEACTRNIRIGQQITELENKKDQVEKDLEYKKTWGDRRHQDDLLRLSGEYQKRITDLTAKLQCSS